MSWISWVIGFIIFLVALYFFGEYFDKVMEDNKRKRAMYAFKSVYADATRGDNVYRPFFANFFEVDPTGDHMVIVTEETEEDNYFPDSEKLEDEEIISSENEERTYSIAFKNN